MAKQADARDLKSLGSDTVPVQIRPAAPRKRRARGSSFLYYEEQPERLPKKKAFSGRGETRRKAKPFFKTASKEPLFRRGDAIASATNNRYSVASLLTNPASSTIKTHAKGAYKTPPRVFFLCETRVNRRFYGSLPFLLFLRSSP